MHRIRLRNGRTGRRLAVAGAALAILGVSAGTASAQTVVSIQQMSSNRCVTAYTDSGHDYGVVTRPCQQYDTAQLWFMRNYGTYVTFEQVRTGRFLDAHEIESLDYRLVTRPAQNNSTQHWILGTQAPPPGPGNDPGPAFPGLPILGSATRGSGLSMSPGTPSVVAQTIRMQSNGRFVDAHEYAGMDYAVVTRPAQNNATQMWRITIVDQGP